MTFEKKLEGVVDDRPVVLECSASSYNESEPEEVFLEVFYADARQLQQVWAFTILQKDYSEAWIKRFWRCFCKNRAFRERFLFHQRDGMGGFFYAPQTSESLQQACRMLDRQGVRVEHCCQGSRQDLK